MPWGLQPNTLQDSATNSAIAFDYLLQAREHMRSAAPDAFELAFPLVERAVQADPGYAEAHAALCQISINRYEIRREVKFIAAAELQCGKALALAPELWQIQYATGLLQTIKGEYADAITTFEGILQANEGTADVTRSLAYAYDLSGQPEQALGIYQQALLDEPGFWLNHNYLGWHHYEQGRYAEAVPAFERAVALAPSEAQPLHDLGTALHLAGDLEGAEIALRKSMELEATDLGAEHLGILYYYSGRLPEAREMFKLALVLSPENFRYWGRLCDVDLAEHGTGQSLEACHKAVALAEKEYAINPNRISTLTRLGFYLAVTGMAEKSDKYMADALALAPENPDVHFLVALAHGQLGREEAMFDALRKTIDKGGSRMMIADEPLLAHLRGDERFEELLAD